MLREEALEGKDRRYRAMIDSSAGPIQNDGSDAKRICHD
jgi:hypothetical protein